MYTTYGSVSRIQAQDIQAVAGGDKTKKRTTARRSNALPFSRLRQLATTKGPSLVKILDILCDIESFVDMNLRMTSLAPLLVDNGFRKKAVNMYNSVVAPAVGTLNQITVANLKIISF